jgi:hypothetical protein
MKVVFAVTLICLAALAAARSEADIRAQWDQFRVEHGKFYASAAEEDRRFHVFAENLAQVDRRNFEDSTATYAVNKFSDLTLDEFIDQYTGFRNTAAPGADMAPNAVLPELRDAPAQHSYVDDGIVNAVKNQGACGSCWAFSTIGGLESQAAKATGKLPNLSEQELVDCCKLSSGCNGGLMHLALQELSQNYNGDVDTEQSYPYHARGGHCDATGSGKEVGLHGVSGYKMFCNLFDHTGACDEAKMLQASWENGPLMIALNANPIMNYHRGVISNCGRGNPNHGVVIVGWGVESGTDYWLVRNSWGSDWGDHGYFKIRRGTGECMINSYVCIATFA